MNAGLLPAAVTVWQNGQWREQDDWLAVERPVALVFNGISHAVMLATPSDLEDLALGFALSEGIVSDAREVYNIEQGDSGDGLELHMEIASERFVALKERRRNLAGRTGCGLCGVEALSQVQRALPQLTRPAALREGLTPAVMHTVLAAHAQLQAHQPLQAQCGAVHAAAWQAWHADALTVVREDVGRHNALDKVIGALVRSGTDPADGFVIVSSRASFELVQKTAMAGSALLASVSGPTHLAVQTAQSCGLALLGFARDQRAVVYT